MGQEVSPHLIVSLSSGKIIVGLLINPAEWRADILHDKQSKNFQDP